MGLSARCRKPQAQGRAREGAGKGLRAGIPPFSRSVPIRTGVPQRGGDRSQSEPLRDTRGKLPPLPQEFSRAVGGAPVVGRRSVPCGPPVHR